MTEQEVTDGIEYPFEFRNLTECVAHIQHNNSYISFRDQDGLVNVYQVKGFPKLNAASIEANFTCFLKRPSNGEIIRQENFFYQELEILLFMMAANLPIGIWEFGMKEAVNGLMRRLPAFDGNEQQSGHRLFDFTGSMEQPVVFDIINITAETLADDGSGNQVGQGDGSFEISVVNGSGGGVPTSYEYSLDGVTYQAGAVFANLAAGSYTAYVRDLAGVVRYETVTVEQIGEGQL